MSTNTAPQHHEAGTELTTLAGSSAATSDDVPSGNRADQDQVTSSSEPVGQRDDSTTGHQTMVYEPPLEDTNTDRAQSQRGGNTNQASSAERGTDRCTCDDDTCRTICLGGTVVCLCAIAGGIVADVYT
jgi:hypothetical protein